jgi:DEAD/DEAH box helicase domain-containing protein
MSVDVLRWEGLLQGEEVAHLTTEPEREARFAPLPESLDPRVREAIGVPQLYAHQRAAWDASERGENVMVTTGTASGKTLAFNLPVLDALAREPKSRALYLYPTKALAQDQFRTLSGYRVPKLKPAIYDGDTPTEQRWQIRKWSNVILTNPDMVHIGLLPNHDRWGDVLANLRYIVVDEAHVYRGVFGSHVANVLRRLRRLARVYGSEPQFLLASATISNPGELGASLRRRGPASGAHDRALESSAARQRVRPARVCPRRGVEAAGDVRRARPAHADLREEPQGGRADPPLHGGAPR